MKSIPLSLKFQTKTKSIIEKIIRVNHAGEFAANRIYQAQIDKFESSNTKEIFTHMRDQELVHLEFFINKMKQSNIRPTIFLPVWNILSYNLGRLTALVGKEAAMMCTESVEEVINEHYLKQTKEIEYLLEKNPNEKDELLEILEKIKLFRSEELEHMNLATQNGAKSSPAYNLFSNLIKFGCKTAIKISEKF